MRRMHRLLWDGIEDEAMTASRREAIVGSLKVAGGGALALAGVPGTALRAAAQDEATPTATEDGAATDAAVTAEAGVTTGATGGQGGQGGQAAAPAALPSTGAGSTGGDGRAAGWLGAVAAGAVATALFVRRRTSAERPADG